MNRGVGKRQTRNDGHHVEKTEMGNGKKSKNISDKCNDRNRKILQYDHWISILSIMETHMWVLPREVYMQM